MTRTDFRNDHLHKPLSSGSGSAPSPAEGPLNSPIPVTIAPSSFDSQPDVWFGTLRGTNASLSSTGQVMVTAPQSSTRRACERVNAILRGWDRSRYPPGVALRMGPCLVAYGTIAVSASGGVSADLFGYGFSTDVPGAPIQVTTASGTATVSVGPSNQVLPIDHLQDRSRRREHRAGGISP